MMRLLPEGRSGAGVTMQKVTLKNARLRVFRPVQDPSAAALLWIHGGGMITGTAKMNDRDCANYARDLKLLVVSVDYRLAPENPFPAALDDCEEAWHWLQDSADELGIDPTRIALSGQSAGGGLAATLAQSLLDRGGIQPASQALFYPMLDDRTAARTELDGLRHRLWNNRNNRAGWSWYLGKEAGCEQVEDYAVAARRANLAGLPRTWIGVGDIDLFYEECCDYASRLEEAGNDCELDVFEGAPHSFDMLVPESSVAREFMEKNMHFLRRSLGL